METETTKFFWKIMVALFWGILVSCTSYANGRIEPKLTEYSIQSGDTLIKVFHYQFPTEVIDNYVAAIDIKDGKMLIATSSQIFSFDGQRVIDIVEVENFRLREINQIARDKEGGIWVWHQSQEAMPGAENIAVLSQETNEFIPFKDWFNHQPKFENMQFRSLDKLPTSELLLNSVDGRIFILSNKNKIRELDLEFPSRYLGQRAKGSILLEQEREEEKKMVEVSLSGDHKFSYQIHPDISGFYRCSESHETINCLEFIGDSATIWNFKTGKIGWEFSSKLGIYDEGDFLWNMDIYFKDHNGLLSVYRPGSESLQLDHHLSIICQKHLNNTIPQLIHIQENGVWMGSSLGLTYATYGPSNFKAAMNQPQALEISIRRVHYLNDSTIWAASNNGLFELELNQDFELVEKKIDSFIASCAGRFIHTFAESPNKPGTYYFTMNEWRIADTENNECRIISLGDIGILEVWDIVHLWGDYFYLATDIGLYLFDESEESIIFVDIITGKEQKFTTRINRIYFDPKTKDVILCTGNGLIFADLKSEDPHVPVLNHLIKARRNINDFIFLDDGSFLISTWDDGLYWLSYPDFKIIQHFQRGNFLYSSSTYNLIKDSRGRIWFSANYGLYVLDPALEIVRKFNTLSGLHELEFNHLAVGASSKKSNPLIYGGINGITYFSPDDIETISEEKFPEILSMTTVGSDGITIKEFIFKDEEENIIIRRGTEGFKLTFKTEYLQRQVQLSYRIKDSGESWKKASGGLIHCANWDKGHYSLELLLELPGKELIYLDNKLKIQVGGWEPGVMEILIGFMGLALLFWVVRFLKKNESERSRRMS
ncbi:MAG: hypothetical protein EA409_06230 [Saprospirales bacterium]|nr:MAG: hypothetical protein EA409_06230 [Saprospirales bacterium]